MKIFFNLVLATFLSVLMTISRSSYTNVTSSNRIQLTIFQAVDSSFFQIWLNWWAVALEFHVLDPKWEIFLACFGDDVADKVKIFHEPGCTRVYPGRTHIKRIYYAKWSAATQALRRGRDLLVIDIDALLVRSPAKLIYSRDIDIIASRDHGPSDLPHAIHWGVGRICTGLIYFKYSQKVLELVELSLKRCGKYGHDQIQFNHILSRSSLVWNEDESSMDDESLIHEGHLAWMHPVDPDFSLFSPELQKSLDQTPKKRYKLVNDILAGKADTHYYDPPDFHAFPETDYIDKAAAVDSQTGRLRPEKITLSMLDRYAVLRYCNEAQELHPGWLKVLKVRPMAPEQHQQLVALHCFVDAGPLGEQGSRKMELKRDVMLALNMWLLRPRLSQLTVKAGVATRGSLLSQEGLEFMKKYVIDSDRADLMHSVWGEGKFDAARNPLPQKGKKNLDDIS